MTENGTTVDLFPDAPLVQGRKGQVAAKFVKIADLKGYDTDTVRPTKSFTEDIRKNGVLESILIEKVGDILTVADGKRRVLASIECEFRTIPAIVIETTKEGQGDVLTLSANFHRRPNPVAELKAIESVMEKVGSAETVAKECGIPLNILRRRLKILRLVPEARRFFDAGRIPLSIAEEMSALPVEVQNVLANKCAEDGKLRMKHVRAARYAEQKTTAATLPDNLFGDQAETSPPEIDLMAHVVADLDTRVQKVRTLLLMDGGSVNPTQQGVGPEVWEATTTLARKVVGLLDMLRLPTQDSDAEVTP